MAGRHKNSKRKPRGTGKPAPEKDRSAHEAARGTKADPVPPLSELSRTPLDHDEFETALQAMHKGTDRECAIMGSALVEEALATAIDAVLLRKEDRAALYHDQGSPFGTLSNKTIAAYAFGICDKAVTNQIHAIRGIRNQFSHALRPITFQTPSISKECAKLRGHEADEIAYANLPDPTQSRFLFESACTGIWLLVTRRGNAIYSALLDRQKALLADAKASRSEGGPKNALSDFLTD